MKAADYGLHTPTVSAFVSTNSICQGQQVPILWPLIFKTGHEIAFAHTSFKWANLASHNAGVTVAIVAISNHAGQVRKLFSLGDGSQTVLKETTEISAYLTAGATVIVEKRAQPIADIPKMIFGNKVVDGGYLRLSSSDLDMLAVPEEARSKFFRPMVGSSDFIKGETNFCLWIQDEDLAEAMQHPEIASRVEAVRKLRSESRDASANQMAARAHQFREMREGNMWTIVLPRITSGNREFLPIGIVGKETVVSSQSFALFDEPIWLISLISSRLHLAWIGTVCGRTRTDFAYSNTLGYNTFPVPKLTEKNRADLTAAAEGILLAREAHFPATIADLYDPEKMPANLRAAHDHNDEVLERIYIGRRFRNDTERLEKLFEMYTRITTKVPSNV